MVSQRDFVLTNHFHKYEDGSLLILVFTDESKQDLIPTNSKVVRGFLHVGGWYLQPISENETKCSLMLEMDLKGIHQTLVKQANKEQGA